MEASKHNTPKPMRIDGRYLRFSHKYKTWQVRTRDGEFVNVNLPMARAYASAGFPIGVQATSSVQGVAK